MNPKSAVWVAGAVLSVVAGTTAQYVYPHAESSPVDIVVTILGVLLIFVWYRFDAAQSGYRRNLGLDIAVIAIALIGLPYYFFRSRGAKRGLIATGLFLLTIIGFSLLTAAGRLAVYHGLQS
ncbi:hypothetical protein J2X02_001862 [Pseudoxanthomonas japonensis]|uniref:hypothetical protein n=1 Tax=Pseudoxanthomonas japonensis TaxID=69284 RepID=UPI001A36CBA6|nr:hypothetical protein [Pseudoxanthomonas japonensis]MBL8257168.1 hypothetical protein [Pseudoxanthomonas mexicana]MDR7069011.1 hypothetical protein [Pseudoxanthomonas japonensis]